MRSALGALDRRLLDQSGCVIGVDEVGRGSLAGPVVVAAAGFRSIDDQPLVQDSKRLSEKQREEAASWIRQHASCWTVVEVWVEVVDRINVREATRLGMVAAVRTLVAPDAVVVSDAMELGISDLACVVQPRADAAYFCVAAASILAKVHRDGLLVELARSASQWGWEQNKGYGTRLHRQCLSKYGRHFLHRRSFKWTAVLP